VHCARAATGTTDWRALHSLYAQLVAIAPTLGARVAFAAALAHTVGPDAALLELDELGKAAARFQPAWATRAHLLAQAGRATEARAAYARAISLTTDGAAREWLEGARRRV